MIRMNNDVDDQNDDLIDDEINLKKVLFFCEN